MIDIKNATTKELVEFYNAQVIKHDMCNPVKKFSDRKTAERRVGELIAELEADGLTAATPQEAEIAQKRSTAIAKSWEDKAVHAKRRQRSAVEVDGVQYRSVKQAFEALKLPLKEHIQFRMQLKAEGKTRCYDRQWKIIPLNY